MRPLLLAAIGVLALTGCHTMPSKTAAPANQLLQAKTFTRKFSANAKTEYLLFLPADYSATASNRPPLILFLHGSGERGTNIWKAAVHGPSKYIAKHPDFPFILVNPQCAEREHWSNESLMALLDEVIQQYHPDTRRIYLTGLSMGGYGSWNLGTSYPDKFAALAPICGGGELISVLLAGGDKRGPALKSLPVWAFHGGKDPTVPLAESERMVKFLKDAGCREVELTVYPNAGHDSWTETYNNPKLYEWFLKHERRPEK